MKYCDNTDHKTNTVKDLKAVKMREEFEGGIVQWCQNCRKRDASFIEYMVCLNCGVTLTLDEELEDGYCSQCEEERNPSQEI